MSEKRRLQRWDSYTLDGTYMGLTWAKWDFYKLDGTYISYGLFRTILLFQVATDVSEDGHGVRIQKVGGDPAKQDADRCVHNPRGQHPPLHHQGHRQVSLPRIQRLRPLRVGNKKDIKSDFTVFEHYRCSVAKQSTLTSVSLNTTGNSKVIKPESSIFAHQM